MTIKERKDRERDERRELILKAAGEIIAAEGIDNLSIRKIANKIEYSPTIVYHYFHDKEDVINQLMKKSYRRIIDTISSVQSTEGNPEQRFEDAIRKYIDLAFQMPDDYKTIMLNNSASILEHTSVLFRGASEKREAVGILCQCLRDIYRNQNIDDNFIELTAQVIWTSTFGFIIRLIIEKNIDEEQKQKLIEHHINFVLKGILN